MRVPCSPSSVTRLLAASIASAYNLRVARRDRSGLRSRGSRFVIAQGDTPVHALCHASMTMRRRIPETVGPRAHPS